MRWKWAAMITVDGAEIDLALEYTPGDRLIHAEADGEALIVKVEAKASACA
jgi:propionyl-CoA carboxylase alpha chain